MEEVVQKNTLFRGGGGYTNKENNICYCQESTPVAVTKTEFVKNIIVTTTHKEFESSNETESQ